MIMSVCMSVCDCVHNNIFIACLGIPVGCCCMCVYQYDHHTSSCGSMNWFEGSFVYTLRGFSLQVGKTMTTIIIHFLCYPLCFSIRQFIFIAEYTCTLYLIR